MSESRLQSSSFASEPSSSSQQNHEPSRYRIMRKGSRYNILGPQGRVFTKYQSASAAGPRWEELTHTPWPYDSSAYERGKHLWELGLIARDQIGKRHIVAQPDNPHPADAPTKVRAGGKNTKRAVKAAPPIIVTLPSTTLALPAPRINLDEHKRLMQALRHNPGLLFTPAIQQALRHEVDYHRPQAKWAQHLLNLLARYEKRTHHHTRRLPSSDTITAKHIAWQEQRVVSTAVG